MRSVRPHSAMTHIPTKWSLAESVRLARAILSGSNGVVEGCIPLASVAHDVVPDWSTDPDFVVIGAVASEADDLPFGKVREHWGSEALAKADASLECYSVAVREQVLSACRNIVERFELSEPAQGSPDGAV